MELESDMCVCAVNCSSKRMWPVFYNSGNYRCPPCKKKQALASIGRRRILSPRTILIHYVPMCNWFSRVDFLSTLCASRYLCRLVCRGSQVLEDAYLVQYVVSLVKYLFWFLGRSES